MPHPNVGMQRAGEEFYAKTFDNEYMENRFQSMTITPEQTARVDAGTAGQAS